MLDIYRAQLAREERKAIRYQNSVADYSKRLVQKQRDLGRSSSTSRSNQLLRDIERLTQSRARAENDAAKSQATISSLRSKVLREEEKQQKASDQAAKRLADSQRQSQDQVSRQLVNAAKNISSLDDRLANLELAVLDRVHEAVESDPVSREYDVFLSHASEDDEMARELYHELTGRQLNVWFDGAELKLGTKLTRQIDHGIANSRVGVILITESFLKGKYWTEMEYSGFIVVRKRLIPILADVTRTELSEYSPLLSDYVGLSTEDLGFDEMAEKIAEILKLPEQG